MAFNGLTPAQYVQFLTSPGIRTVAGPVPLTAYVSTDPDRFTCAVAVHRFFNRLLGGFSNSTADYTVDSARRRPPRPYPGSRLFADPIDPHTPVADALNDLEQMHQRIVRSGGLERESNWRRVFSGQGTYENIKEVMNFIVIHREILRAVTFRAGTSPFEPYLDAPPLAALQRMVTDNIFGIDCLGFVGTYLVACGVEPRYPEYTQAQYCGLHFRGVNSLDEIDVRCVVLWLDGGTPHIGVIDSVTSRNSRSITVNLCHSTTGARNGPQTNPGVRLEPTGGSPYDGEFGRCSRFTIHGATSQTTGPVEVGKRAQW